MFTVTLMQLLMVILEMGVERVKIEHIRNSVDLLDLDTDTYTNTKTFEVTGNTVMIVEGVLLYRMPLDDLFDYRIFLDVSFDEVLHRARERDVPKYGEVFLQRYTDRYIPAQKLYLDEFRPKEKCQIVINNNDFQKPSIVR